MHDASENIVPLHNAAGHPLDDKCELCIDGVGDATNSEESLQLVWHDQVTSSLVITNNSPIPTYHVVRLQANLKGAKNKSLTILDGQEQVDYCSRVVRFL